MQPIQFQGVSTIGELPFFLSLDPKIVLTASLCAAQAIVAFKKNTPEWLPQTLNILYSITLSEFLITERDKSDLSSLALFAASVVGYMHTYMKTHAPKPANLPKVETVLQETAGSSSTTEQPSGVLEQTTTSTLAAEKTAEPPLPTGSSQTTDQLPPTSEVVFSEPQLLKPLPTFSFELTENPFNLHPINFTYEDFSKRAKTHIEEAQTILEYPFTDEVTDNEKKSIEELKLTLNKLLCKETCTRHFDLILRGGSVYENELQVLKEKSEFIIKKLSHLELNQNTQNPLISQIKLLLACDLLDFLAIFAEITAKKLVNKKKTESLLSPILHKIYCYDKFIEGIFIEGIEPTQLIRIEQARWSKETLDTWNKNIHPEATNYFLSSLKRLHVCCHTKKTFPYNVPSNRKKAEKLGKGSWKVARRHLKQAEKKGSLPKLVDCCHKLISNTEKYSESKYKFFFTKFLDQDFIPKNGNPKEIHDRHLLIRKPIKETVKVLQSFIFPDEIENKTLAVQIISDILNALTLAAEACSPKIRGNEIRGCSALYELVQPLYTVAFKDKINAIGHKTPSNLLLKALEHLHDACHSGQPFAFV